MRFVSVRDLRSKSAQVWRQLATDGDMVVTSRGRPIAILTAVSDDNVEESLAALRSARAIAAVHAMQMRSVKLGLDRMSLDDINAEIEAYRRERAK